MKFNYSALIANASDTGEPMVLFRPEVTMRIHGPSGSRDFLALVDTGADHSILPESIARDLDIPLHPCKGPSATAFGGQQIALSYADVELELVHADGELRWFPRVYFVSGDADKETIILGHQGFLDYFTATFDGEECTVNLQPNDYLPTEKESGE
jgi:hypothetical protein